MGLLIKGKNSLFERESEFPISGAPPFHPSFYQVSQNLKRWMDRFPISLDDSVFSDLNLFYLLASKRYLDHRDAFHLFRLILSIHIMQKRLLNSAMLFPHTRHLQTRWFPTNLVYPFSSKPVLGCLIGFNIMDRYELFDEENVLLALSKYLPELQLVKESVYYHTSHYRNLRMIYLEVEKKKSAPFSLTERIALKTNLEEKIKNSIQMLSPIIYMGQNEEEIYKNILMLSQEVQSVEDPPQAYISLNQQTGKEIVFRVILVYPSPFHHFSLKERFFNCTFTSERVVPIKHLSDHPVEAQIFTLRLEREASLLRSDGSLDFYSARQKVVSLITNAIGEFRDYNGGILIKRQELLHHFKNSFPKDSGHDPEFLESFFFALTPLEKQVVLPRENLSTLFALFLTSYRNKLPQGRAYTIATETYQDQTYLVVRGENNSITDVINKVLQEPSFSSKNMAYNFINTAEGTFFNCILLDASLDKAHYFIQAIQEALHEWDEVINNQQTLRIGLEYAVYSLDPRIGGEGSSGNVLKLLFEGLTRLNHNGRVENALAESVQISSDLKSYTFKLRPSFWNDGTPLLAHDFEYAWKKVLSPDFQTVFATSFYPIKNARRAKEGVVSPDEIGIHVLDDRTLRVDLEFPIPYFLQLTARQIYSPINRIADQQYPEWPYQSGKNYPCNGPFQLKVNEPKQGYHLVKNPFYWDSKDMTWDQIVLTRLSASQAFHAFQKKEIDWIGSPYGGWHSFYVPGGDAKVISSPNRRVCWFVFNTALSPFHHRKIRQAFAYAIKRAEFTAYSLTPTFSPLLPSRHKKQHLLFPDYDLERAQKLLHEGLDELGLTLQDLPTIEFLFHEMGVGEEIACCLKNQFKEGLGIECRLKPLPWRTQFSRMTHGDFQIGLMHWRSFVDNPNPDPIDTLNAFQYTSGGVNFANWENPDFQRLLRLSENEVNPFQRSSYLLRAEEILSLEMPIVPLYYQPYQALVRQSLFINKNGSYDPISLVKLKKG